MALALGISTLCCALIWLVLGGYIMKLTFSDDDCFSRWWPRIYAITFLLQGIGLVMYAIMAFTGKITTTTKSPEIKPATVSSTIAPTATPVEKK